MYNELESNIFQQGNNFFPVLWTTSIAWIFIDFIQVYYCRNKYYPIKKGHFKKGGSLKSIGNYVFKT
jgi:hypothetical protein